MKVTEQQLAAALEDFYVRVRATSSAMGTSSAQLADADETAKAIFAALDRTAALREDDDGPNVIGADHVCEHPIGDREVQLMVDILRGMAGLDPDAKQRIRTWVDERFARAHPF